MSSDTSSFFIPKMRILKWSSQQVPSTTLDGSSNLPGKLFNSLSRSSTNDHAAGNAQALSARDASQQTQSSTINVVLFGETGVGKSSVINLIARKAIAQVSSDVNGCTMQSYRYNISFDDMDFAIFDTIGLEEPQMGINGYLKAIEKAYELISKLGAAGGIHLLLFCMRGGRITATTQSNYRLFCECLCSTKVPIALVFTGLEREERMDNWWTRNKKYIEDYGIKSDGHACVTAVQDEMPEDHKFEYSQTVIRDLLKNCARKNDGFSLESHSWFAKFARGMKSFVPAKKSPKKRDVMKVLTQRCKLDRETARKIADMMDGGDAEKNENKDLQAGNGEGEIGKESDTVKNPTNDADPAYENNAGDTAFVVIEHRGGDVIDKGMAEDASLVNTPGDVKVVPGVSGDENKDASPDTDNVEAAPDFVGNKNREVTSKNTAEGALAFVPRDAKAAPQIAQDEEDAPSDPDNVEAAPGFVSKKDREITGKNIAEDAQIFVPGDAKAAPQIAENEERIRSKRVDPLPNAPIDASQINGRKENKDTNGCVAMYSPPGDIKAVPRIVRGEERRATSRRVADPQPSNAPRNFTTVPRVVGDGEGEASGGFVTAPNASNNVKSTHHTVKYEEREVVDRRVTDHPTSNSPNNAKGAPQAVGNGERDATGRLPPNAFIDVKDAQHARLKEKETMNKRAAEHSTSDPSNTKAGKEGQLVKKGSHSARGAEQETTDGKKGSDGLEPAVSKRGDPWMPGGFTP